MSTDDTTVEAGRTLAEWLASHPQWLWDRIKEIRSWIKGSPETEEKRGILILGSGGAGKSTLAGLLSGKYDSFLDVPEEYRQSLSTETSLMADAPDVEIVVPPAQPEMIPDWEEILRKLASGEYRGLIWLSSYGYHNFSLDYTQESAYVDGMSKEEFVKEYCAAQRKEELMKLRTIVPYLEIGSGNLWMLTVVAKQDLWYPSAQLVEAHYRNGEYEAEIRKIANRRTSAHFRHEIVFASLVIRRFRSKRREALQLNAAGYDQELQRDSQVDLFRKLYALRQWEGRN
jgi:hypothetical protein